VKPAGLLETPFVVTTTLSAPSVPLEGTRTVIELSPQFVITVAGIELKVTDPWTDPNPAPVIVADAPLTPEGGEIPVMTGMGVKAMPLLA
jgi:hypothetical protein